MGVSVGQLLYSRFGRYESVAKAKSKKNVVIDTTAAIKAVPVHADYLVTFLSQLPQNGLVTNLCYQPHDVG